MLPTSWWICKSFKLDDSVTNFIHPSYSRVKFLILFKSLLGLMGSMLDIFVYKPCSKPLEVLARKDFRKVYVGSLVLFAVSPCPLALIKHLEHERRQITASNAGVQVLFYLLADPEGTLPMFHRAGCDMGAVTCEAQAIALNRVAFFLWLPCAFEQRALNFGLVWTQHP